MSEKISNKILLLIKEAEVWTKTIERITDRREKKR
jgi:hypothetical protein